MADLGERKDGYVSDITRMMFLGTPSPEYLTVHQSIENAVSAALQTARSGVLAKEADAAARKVIEQAGYGEYFVHRLGHGVGNKVHEQPYLNATSNAFLEEGMVFSIEPGIYLSKKFGVHHEDIVIKTAHGAKILSEFSRDLSVID